MRWVENEQSKRHELRNTVLTERWMFNSPYEKERAWCYCENNYTFHIIKFLSVLFLFGVNLCICICLFIYLWTVRSCVVIPLMFHEHAQSHGYNWLQICRRKKSQLNLIYYSHVIILKFRLVIWSQWSKLKLSIVLIFCQSVNRTFIADARNRIL